MAVNVKFDLTEDEIIAAILYETSKQPEINLEWVKNKTQTKGIVIKHLCKFGLSQITKPMPASLLVRRQEVKSALRGILI